MLEIIHFTDTPVPPSEAWRNIITACISGGADPEKAAEVLRGALPPAEEFFYLIPRIAPAKESELAS